MKKSLTVPFILLFFGLISAGVAAFAESIGLDENPQDWSRARIAIFVIGIFLVLCAAVYFWIGHKFRDAASKFWSVVHKHPVAIWLWKRQSIQYASKLIRGYSFALPILVFIFVLYVWLASSGTWTEWVSPTRYYDSLAKGFEYKTLSVAMTPDPRLAELENPYDPQNWRGTIQVPMDISYYKGRYYLYWGPAPAFILFLLRPFYSGKIGDLYLVFVFIC